MCLLAGCAGKDIRVVLISSPDVVSQRNIQALNLASRDVCARDTASSRQRQPSIPHFGVNASYGALHCRLPRRLLTCTCRVASSSRAVPLGKFNITICTKTDLKSNGLINSFQTVPLTARCLAPLLGASLVCLVAQPNSAEASALVSISGRMPCVGGLA